MGALRGFAAQAAGYVERWETALRILLTGATGLIGGAVLTRLLAAGHEVLAFVQHPPRDDHRPGLTWCTGDLGRRTRRKHWRAELPGIDVVINTIGIFRERFPHTFDVVHHEAPAALWEACDVYGVRRVVHLSALGAAEDAPTEYWRSKARGDAKLLGHAAFERWIVRPSLVYAENGPSAALFRKVAALPWLAVPRSAAAVQPIHLDDLADLIVRLALAGGNPEQPVISAIGPTPLPWADWLQTLRAGMGMPPAPVVRLPDWLARFGGWAAEGVSGGLVTADSIRMLERGNVGEPGAAARMQALLGRPLRPPAHFATPAERLPALVGGALPLARLSLAFLWLFTALVSFVNWPVGLQLLADLGIAAPLRWPLLAAGALLDAAFGVLTLWRPRPWLWRAQMALVLAYTAIITVGLPGQWLHPFGPVSKNLPVLALLWLCDRLHGKA